MLTMVEAGLRIDVDHRPREVVVTLRGELDVSNVAALQRALSNLDPAYRAPVLVDCGQLTFIGAAGIGAIAGAAGAFLSEGHRLQVVRLGAFARQLFVFCGLGSLLPDPETPDSRRACRRQPKTAQAGTAGPSSLRPGTVSIGA